MKIINLIEDTKGNEKCCYEHGLSFYIETKKHKILMDTGATDKFLLNAEVLGINLKNVDTVVLSHGHYDHAGGLLPFSKINPEAEIFMKPQAGGGYYHITDSMEKYIGIDKDILKLPQCVFVDGDEMVIDDELTLFSGVVGRKYFAKGNLSLKKKTGNDFEQDEFDHEQCLVISQDEKKILMSGCAHNGIINILERYKEIYDAYPDVVISGFHMMKKEDYTEEEVADIKETAKVLVDTGAMFYSGHCTGQRAYDIMKEIMGDRLEQIHSGEVIAELISCTTTVMNMHKYLK